jgi:thiamine biosynthesis lipoprotein
MVSVPSSVSFPALGTTAVVVVDDPASLARALELVQRVIERIDLACSRFRDDSELVGLNAAAGSPVQVSRLLLDAVSAAIRAAVVTDGDVSPTVGQALIALGYDRDFSELEPALGGVQVQPRSIVSVPGWRTIEIDPERSVIRLPRGVALDLGATAKALASDLAAAQAQSATGGGVLVSLGGDIALAGPAPASGWRIRVTDDHRAGPDAPGQWITLRSGGLATSSTTVRRWHTAAGGAHHLLDPATGAPADVVWRTASVTAASCLDANIASTATIVRGERAVPWLESLGLPSRLVAADGTVRHVAGWPSAGDDLAPAPAGLETSA